MGEKWMRPEEISAMVLQKLKQDAEEKLGIKIDEFVIGEILPPKEISDAAAQKRKEAEEATAEGVEVDNVITLIDKLVAKGFTREKAAEIVQTERNKANTSRNIITLEGFEGVADSLSAGLAKALGTTFGDRK